MAGKKTPVVNEKQDCRIHFRDGDNGTKRVWRSTWAGDQFEVWPRRRFHHFKTLATKLGIEFVYHQEDDD